RRLSRTSQARDRPDGSPGADRGPHHRARRRRAVHRAHDSRRHGRARRLRPAARGQAGGAGRPRAARASDPAGLRRSRRPDDRARISAGDADRAWRAGPGRATRAAGVSAFGQRHLLGIEPLSAADIETILTLSERFLEIAQRPIKKVPTLRGKTVINLFLEASTRTRTSFEIAAKRLSADAVNISGSGSSTTKGETLLDTARNLDAKI